MKARPSALWSPPPDQLDPLDHDALRSIAGVRDEAFDLSRVFWETMEAVISMTMVMALGGFSLSAVVFGLVLWWSGQDAYNAVQAVAPVAWFTIAAGAVVATVFTRCHIRRCAERFYGEKADVVLQTALHLLPLGATRPGGLRYTHSSSTHAMELPAAPEGGCACYVALCTEKRSPPSLTFAADAAQVQAEALTAALRAGGLGERLERAGVRWDALRWIEHETPDGALLVLEDLTLPNAPPSPSELPPRDMSPANAAPPYRTERVAHDAHDAALTLAEAARALSIAVGAHGAEARATWRLLRNARTPEPPAADARERWSTVRGRGEAVAPLRVRAPHVSAQAQVARWTFVGGALALEAALIAGTVALSELLVVPALVWPLATIAGYRISAQPYARGPLWRPRRRSAPDSSGRGAQPALELTRGVLSLGEARIDMSAPFGVQLHPSAAPLQHASTGLGLTLTQGSQRLAVRAEGVAVDVSDALDPLDSRAPLIAPTDLRALWEHVRAWSALHGSPPAWGLEPLPDSAQHTTSSSMLGAEHIAAETAHATQRA